MEEEKANKLANGDQLIPPSSSHSKDTNEKYAEEAKVESQAYRTDAASLANSPKEQEDKYHEDFEAGSPRQDRPSERIQEAQGWNNRPRNQYGNQKDRPRKRHNNKADLVSQRESSDPVAIRKQVEFYFSDSNLLTDKFLFTKVEGHKNLPVPISIIHSFKRMRHFQPLSAVVTALKDSMAINVVEDDTAIQRKIPLPEGLVGKPMVEIQKVHEDKSMARSVYAKGFGEEQPSTQFDIEAFFAQHGSTNSVRLRRAYDGSFKGSVFVEFDSEETQKAFLSLDPKPKWQSNELQIKSKKQYCDDKVDDITAGRVRPNNNDRSHQKGDRDWGGRGRSKRGEKDGRDDKDDRDWRVRREEDRKSGFKDGNRGKHKGFGASGRGRGGRDRSKNSNDELRGKAESEKHKGKTPSIDNAEHHAKTPTSVTAESKEALEGSKQGREMAADVVVGPAVESAADAGSRKRAREEDDEEEDQRTTKKVDSKIEDS